MRDAHANQARRDRTPIGHLSPPKVATLFLLGVTFALAAAACGDANAGAIELSTLQAEHADEIDTVREAAAAEHAATEAKMSVHISDLEAALADLEEREASASADLATTRNENKSVLAKLTASDRALAAAEERADEAEKLIAELLTKYDAEIRAEAQVAWKAEIERACIEAGDGPLTIGNYVNHTDELAAIGTKAELTDLVVDCAEPIRSQSEEQRLRAECSTGSADQVTKDPEAQAGNCFVMFVIPWQWDSRTGECNFLGSWEGSNLGTQKYKYDGDGIFRAPADVCDRDLADADQDDLVQVWATLTGSYRYDTAAGGTNEIPDFTIRKLALVAKA